MYKGKFAGKSSGKQAGKYGCRRRKHLALILSLILLLGMTIGGTVAYLARKADPVVNAFVDGKVNIEIHENVSNNVKDKIVIENAESNIPVYIRVALVGNWADAENRICVNHSSAQPSFTLGTDWVEGDDGFYYYKKPVAVGGETTDLLGSGIELEKDNDGCSYQLEVIASAIQAQGDNDSKTAVSDAWGIDPASLQ